MWYQAQMWCRAGTWGPWGRTAVLSQCLLPCLTALALVLQTLVRPRCGTRYFISYIVFGRWCWERCEHGHILMWKEVEKTGRSQKYLKQIERSKSLGPDGVYWRNWCPSEATLSYLWIVVAIGRGVWQLAQNWFICQRVPKSLWDSFGM